MPILEESGSPPGATSTSLSRPSASTPAAPTTPCTTPKVVGGLTEDCTEAAASLYGEICDEVVRVSGPEPAERDEAA